MYQTALLLHSWMRWAVLAAGAVAVVAALRGGPSARARVLPFVVAVDLQLLLGLWLYLFLSPLTRGSGGGAALRYWRADHPAMAVIAVALVHAGSVVSRKPRRELQVVGGVLLGAALVFLLVVVPWTRPLFRR